MAGSQVSKSVAIDWFINATYGFEAATIDEYDTTAEPEVQAGSKLEINGDLYIFSSAESITGWSGISNSTQAYIKFVPSGSSVTVEFTDTAPTWSDAKQGWYDSNDRYLFAVYKDASGNYTLKSEMPKKQNSRYFDSAVFNSLQTFNDNSVQYKTALFTGTTDASGHVTITSTGITAAKILIIYGYWYSSTYTRWGLFPIYRNEIEDSGTIKLYGSSSTILKPYRVVVVYEA